MHRILAWYKMNAADTSIPDGWIAPVSTIDSFQPQTSAFDVKRRRHRGNSIKTDFFWLAMSIFTSDGTTRHFFPNISQILLPMTANVPLLISAIAPSPPRCARSYSTLNPRRRNAALNVNEKVGKSTTLDKTALANEYIFIYLFFFNLHTSNHCFYSSPSSIRLEILKLFLFFNNT